MASLKWSVYQPSAVALPRFLTCLNQLDLILLPLAKWQGLDPQRGVCLWWPRAGPQVRCPHAQEQTASRALPDGALRVETRVPAVRGTAARVSRFSCKRTSSAATWSSAFTSSAQESDDLRKKEFVEQESLARVQREKAPREAQALHIPQTPRPQRQSGAIRPGPADQRRAHMKAPAGRAPISGLPRVRSALSFSCCGAPPPRTPAAAALSPSYRSERRL